MSSLYFELRVVMSGDPRFLPAMRHTIENLTLELGWPESGSRAITLALEEALTNKIRHAYKNDPSGRIQTEIRIEDGALIFRLTDWGEAPDPARICSRDRDSTRAGGLGTHIIRDVMDSVIYQTTSDGNQLILTKKLPEAAK